ncbi:MAG: ATP-binding cassette domain-containing protein [Planctomycetota bacterium]
MGGDAAVAVLDRVTRHFPSDFSLGPLDLAIHRGERLAVSGPSGSGKSTLLHLLALLDRPSSGSLQILGRRTESLSQPDLDELRRGHIGLAMQEDAPYASLSARENLLLAYQLSRRALRRSEARARADADLEAFELAARASHRPAQLSGGERCRLAIARALACGGDLVALDEPTASLDPRLSRKIMQHVLDTCAAGQALVVATHDASVARLCTRTLDLRGAQEVVSRLPSVTSPAGEALLEASDLWKRYPTPSGRIDVLRGVSLRVHRGECVALVGPSGSGKSTLIAVLAGIDSCDSGTIWRFAGAPTSAQFLERWRATHVGLLVQKDALGLALSPQDHIRVQQQLARSAGSRRSFPPAGALLERFHLQNLARQPALQLSGGERRRVALSRAMAHAPDLILADEPASGVQQSLAFEIAAMLRECASMGCGVLFTTHDPSLIALADRCLLLEDGVLKEAG